MATAVCIWMNIRSHYQQAFFEAITQSGLFDLEVRYVDPPDPSRKAQGWTADQVLRAYERQLSGTQRELGALATIPDWRTRVHIVSPFTTPGVAGQLHDAGATVCYWAEMPGIRIGELVRFWMGLFDVAERVSAVVNRRRYRLWSTFAKRVLVHGDLARRGFARRGVSDAAMCDVFYAPAAAVGRTALSKAPSEVPCTFIYVGTLERRKGTDVLVRAFAQMRDKTSRLVLVGLDKSSGQYHDLANRLGVAERVRFAGPVPSDLVSDEVGRADVLILPSRFDGWGAVLNEGASAGVALIGTDMCGASFHAIKNGVNGFIVRRSKWKPLQEAMDAYAASPEMRDDHGLASARMFAESLSPEANVLRLVDALDGVVPFLESS